MSSRGHEVVVFGQRGELCDLIAEMGLEFIQAPSPGLRPSSAVVGALRAVLTHRRVDLAHAYEWPPSLESALAAARTPTTVVSSIMSMAVAPFLPTSMPLLVGTPQIAAHERRHRRHVRTMLPPVDLARNQGHMADAASTLRRRYDIDPNATLVVCVSRVADQLKLEGLLTAARVVPDLGSNVELLLVGDGPAGERLRQCADQVNRRAGRRVVTCAGHLLDPRPAYAAADVVLGMGGSAVRGLAFGKPVVVQGERGFWRRVDSDSVDDFLWQGWFGVGEDERSGCDALKRELGPLVRDGGLRDSLGRFGRQIAVKHHGLHGAAANLEKWYQEVNELSLATSRGDLSELLRVSVGWASHTTRSRWHSIVGRGVADDFNAKPVATLGVDRPPGWSAEDLSVTQFA